MTTGSTSVQDTAQGRERREERRQPGVARRAGSGSALSISRAVVTGASSGIGRAFARRLGGAGASLLLVGRDRPRLEALAGEVATRGTAADLALADLADETSLAALAQRIADAEPDLLVNAAGLARFGNFAESEPEQAELHVRVNVLALMRLTHAVLPGMIARGSGTIINVSSLMWFDDRPGWTGYISSKAFVTRLTENLAAELQGSGVKLQALSPGPVSGTGFFAGAGFDPSVFPADVVMDVDDVVQASLAALARDELICIPGLEDPGVLEDFRRARLSVLGEGRRGALAKRYSSA
jgi:short-subunit dehydrogenase